MSEGTMQRRAQREKRDQRVERAGRRGRVLVSAAALPVILLAAGCSSDSGSGDEAKASAASASTPASPSPTVRAAAYRTLPKPCDVLSEKTLEELVPKGTKSGKEGSSDDVSSRASCSWNSLDNNGVKGSQFRWLNVSLLRFESDVTRGSGEELAQEYYEKQVTDVRSVEGAKDTKAEPLAGTGDEATAVRYDLKKKEGSFKQQTIVARVENVVVTLDYNGAGLAGEKTPDADDLMKDATKAAKEVVAAVTEANEGGGAAKSPGASGSPSKPAGSPSASAGSPSGSAGSPAASSKAPAKKS
ncbi:DUF3558 family protein [Streptomyces sp. NPDC052687]|uniref:DUF3558 family protein n=1 Tax=Streptomyces sp. NPDC052687 TaxID=3154759 RepID=UPI0034296FB7